MNRVAAVVLAVVVAAGCQDDGGRLPEHVLSGEIMGTTFSVKIVAADDVDDWERLGRQIRERLASIDAMLSTYRSDSDLSAFNRGESLDWVPVAMPLCHVVSAALAISRVTNGAFDITVGPLVNLWGFGPEKRPDRPPADDQVASALERTGYLSLSADCDKPALRKSKPGMYVDLSGFAKGFAVDQLARLLDEHRIENYLVEIGGEIRVRGRNAAGANWAIAIEKPLVSSRAVQTIVHLTDRAMATSGDYRNFFEYDGQRFSHTIDPATGRPVTHDGASVTVVDGSTARADGLATALLVMGPVDGLVFAEENDLAAYYLVHADGGFEDRMTSRFSGLLE